MTDQSQELMNDNQDEFEGVASVTIDPEVPQTPASLTPVKTDVVLADDDHPPLNQSDSNVFLNKMSRGFLELKERMNSKEMPEVISSPCDAGKTHPINSHATVNFIDLTSSRGPNTPTDSSTQQKFKFMSPLSGKTSPNANMVNLDLYEHFNITFSRNFDCTLHNIHYENIRGGATGVINKLPVHTVLTRSHVAGETSTTDVPWGGTSGAGGTLTDPAEWHNVPHCHVFIAACEGLEHYRTKVRPALQAFVSQIEAASGMAIGSRGSAHGGKSPALSGSCSAHYVIIYVPIRTKEFGGASRGQSPIPNSDGPGNRLGANIASRITAARRQIQNSTSREMSDSVHSGATNSTDMEIDFTDTGSVASSGSATVFISKGEKEVFRKFVADFPNGRPCIMSTLTEPPEATAMHPLKSQEWTHFLRTMAVAIVNGFQDRCRRYDEELRRLDAARAGHGNKTSKGKSGEPLTFDLCHFFLVKESLAFTYEQMQLPLDALLQYEELRLFLPESFDERQVNSETTDNPHLKKGSSSKKLIADFDEEARKLAIEGDTVGFRRRLRSTTDLVSIEQIVLQYLFAREVDLLFKLNSPSEILVRALEFATSMYHMKRRGFGLPVRKRLEVDGLGQRTRDAEIWALDFSWDVKCAAELFFVILVFENDESNADFSFSKLADDPIGDIDTSEGSPTYKSVVDPVQESLERTVASKLCDLLEFARLRFLRLGDTELPVDNPIRELWRATPADMMMEWGPWEAGKGGLTYAKSDDGFRRNFEAAIAMDEDDPPGIVDQKKIARLSEGAFCSTATYEERYLELSAAISYFCRQSGRKRLSSRLQAERAELHMRNREYKLAVKALLPIINSCAIDRWDRGHFWRLFRLASCQRMTGKVASYLNTLTQCFGPHLSSIAPPKAADVLQRDFEVIVGQESVTGFRLGIASFLEAEVEVGATASGTTSMLLHFVRKKLVKSFCNVGDDMKVTLTVTSHLARRVELTKLTVLLVSLEKYEYIFHKRGVVGDDDAFQILHQGTPVMLECGRNIFEFYWKPMTTGIYILSTVQVQWKNACFHYDSAVIRKPISAIEVLPSDPTQSIELNPLFLIPGQIQLVRITFNPGTDVIVKGSVELICSDGLQVIPPGTDPKGEQWSERCTVDLPPTKPGQPVVLTTSVKSNVIKTLEQKLGLDSADYTSVVAGSVQTMHAKVTTSYHHGLFSKVEGVIDTCMETSLEAMVTTLDKPAFTVDQSEVFRYDGRTLINVSLHCNTPVPFYVKEWNLKLPMLRVADDGDMNQHLYEHAVAEGEQLSFGFNCVQTEADAQHVDSPFLLVVLQDEFGKTFNQVLPLNLDSLYDKLRQDDEFRTVNVVSSDLQLSVIQGLVGAPVTLMYHIDANGLSKPKNRSTAQTNGGNDDSFILKYVLACEGTDWIVGGKTQGILGCTECKVFTLEFVGIPIHPGVIKTFPSLRVSYKSSDEHDVPSITVHSRNPDLFNSLAFVNHVALACSAGLEV